VDKVRAWHHRAQICYLTDTAAKDVQLDRQAPVGMCLCCGCGAFCLTGRSGLRGGDLARCVKT
jgi:hypothetical protein